MVSTQMGYQYHKLGIQVMPLCMRYSENHIKAELGLRRNE